MPLLPRRFSLLPASVRFNFSVVRFEISSSRAAFAALALFCLLVNSTLRLVHPFLALGTTSTLIALLFKSPSLNQTALRAESMPISIKCRNSFKSASRVQRTPPPTGRSSKVPRIWIHAHSKASVGSRLRFCPASRWRLGSKTTFFTSKAFFPPGRSKPLFRLNLFFARKYLFLQISTWLCEALSSVVVLVS